MLPKMKRMDSKFINTPVKNATLTRYRRGIKTVYTDLDTDFGKARRTFQKKWNNPFDGGTND